jgi:hypothetical protein
VRVFPGRFSGRVHHALWKSGASAGKLLRAGRDEGFAAGRNEQRQPSAPPVECDEVVSIPIGTPVESY